MTKSIYPPNSQEAELIVIGSMLSSASHNDFACQHLLPQDFFQSKNKIIFSALKSMYEEEKPAETQLLIQKLKDEGNLSQITTEYIFECTSFSNNAYQLEEYVNIVLDKSMRRELMLLLNNSTQDISDEKRSAEEILEDFSKEISRILKKKSSHEFYTLTDIVTGKKSPVGVSLGEYIENKIKDRRDCKDSNCTGLSTGISSIDSYLNGLGKSNLIILAARPGVGKTTFALDVAVDVGIRSRVPVGIFSLEMSIPQIVLKLFSNYSGMSYADFDRGNEVDLEEVKENMEKIKNAPIILYESSSCKIGDIMTAARKMKEIHDIRFIIIDYLQLIGGSARFKNSDSRVNEVSEISRSLKILAKELNIPILCLSQLNRAVESRNDKMPMLSDLRESGAIEQDADQVLMLHRPDLYNPSDSPGKVIVNIAKNRHGQTGRIDLAIDLKNGNFYEYSHMLKSTIDDFNTNRLSE